MAREWSDLFIVDGRASEGPPGDRGEEEGERQRRGGRFRRLRENLRKTRQALTAEVQATLFEELDAVQAQGQHVTTGVAATKLRLYDRSGLHQSSVHFGSSTAGFSISTRFLTD